MAFIIPHNRPSPKKFIIVCLPTIGHSVGNVNTHTANSAQINAIQVTGVDNRPNEKRPFLVRYGLTANLQPSTIAEGNMYIYKVVS